MRINKGMKKAVKAINIAYTRPAIGMIEFTTVTMDKVAHRKAKSHATAMEALARFGVIQV